MQLIFGKENADSLRERYTVLELETVEKDGVSIDVFCLIPGDKLALTELPQLDSWIKLHNDFLHGYKTQQYNYCRQAIEYLLGKFSGELDTFYNEILSRIDNLDTD
jgi:hypothetical protein